MIEGAILGSGNGDPASQGNGDSGERDVTIERDIAQITANKWVTKR
jgi:hypothetical protein